MTIKTATLKDKEQILDILYAIASDLKSKQITQWLEWLAPTKSDIKWIDDLINNDSFFLIIVDNSIVGIFSLSDQDHKYWGKSVEKSKYLHSLAVLPHYKSKQFGKHVIDLLKLDLKEKNYTFLRLDCISSNKKLKLYYLNQGFNEVGLTNIGINSFTLLEYSL
jgi:ribosomal protein S18 acetylase RimI-like enzyme